MRVITSITFAIGVLIVLAPLHVINCQEPQQPETSDSRTTSSAPDKSAGVVDDATSRSDAPIKKENSADSTTVPSQDSATLGSKSPYVFPDRRKRLDSYVLDTVGPRSMVKVAAGAALRQWNDDPDEWGQGASGYGKRFASTFGSNAITQTVIYGMSEALKEDSGFEKSRRNGFWPRLSDALVQNFTSRTQTGKHVISAPKLMGVYAGSVVPNVTWFPSRYSYKDGLRTGTYSFATGFALNALREFVFNW